MEYTEIFTTNKIDRIPYKEVRKAVMKHVYRHTPLYIGSYPRSGTRYLALALQNVELDIKHESYGEDGICSWHQVMSSKDSGFSYDKIVHLVRNPWKCISSAVNVLDKHGNSYIRHVIGPTKRELVRRHMLGWITWNNALERKIEASGGVRINIDKLWKHNMDEWNKLLQYINPDLYLNDMTSIEPGKVNHVADYQDIPMYMFQQYVGEYTTIQKMYGKYCN